MWVEADAENLPFDDRTYDIVMSSIGAMFAPHLGELGQQPRLLRIKRDRDDQLDRMAVVNLNGLIIDRVKVFGSNAPLDVLPDSSAEDRSLLRHGAIMERAMGASAAGEVVGRFYEEFGSGNIEAALEVCSEDLEIVDPGMGQVRGRERFREYLETFKRAMPDARAIVDQTVEAGQTVAVEGRFTGTHTGPLATDEGDVEPTGAGVDLRFADVSRVRDGKIVAYHTYYDQLGLLTQLGLMDKAR